MTQQELSNFVEERFSIIPQFLGKEIKEYDVFYFKKFIIAIDKLTCLLNCIVTRVMIYKVFAIGITVAFEKNDNTIVFDINIDYSNRITMHIRDYEKCDQLLLNSLLSYISDDKKDLTITTVYDHVPVLSAFSDAIGKILLINNHTKIFELDYPQKLVNPY